MEEGWLSWCGRLLDGLSSIYLTLAQEWMLSFYPSSGKPKYLHRQNDIVQRKTKQKKRCFACALPQAPKPQWRRPKRTLVV